MVSMMTRHSAAVPVAAGSRGTFTSELASVGQRAAMEADEARAAGLDPLTFREIALDSGVGANLLDVVPVPAKFSFSAFDTYDHCPMQYAFKYVYRIPEPATPVGALTFGSTAHPA